MIFGGDFDIDHNTNVTVKPPRRIPLVINPKVKHGIDDLESQGITSINKGNTKSYVINMVVVEQSDGSVGLCINPHDLNNVTKRTPHLILSIEDISFKLSNSSVYSVLDLKCRTRCCICRILFL